MPTPAEHAEQVDLRRAAGPLRPLGIAQSLELLSYLGTPPFLPRELHGHVLQVHVIGVKSQLLQAFVERPRGGLILPEMPMLLLPRRPRGNPPRDCEYGDG